MVCPQAELTAFAVSPRSATMPPYPWQIPNRYAGGCSHRYYHRWCCRRYLSGLSSLLFAGFLLKVVTVGKCSIIDISRNGSLPRKSCNQYCPTTSPNWYCSNRSPYHSKHSDDAAGCLCLSPCLYCSCVSEMFCPPSPTIPPILESSPVIVPSLTQ